KTLIRPPQDRPTCHAVSSATPNSSMRDFPSEITSDASATTAPSTQPPETEPSKLPSASMTRWLPTGRGAEPQVSTTVAMATERPSSSHPSAIISGSFMCVVIASRSLFDEDVRHSASMGPEMPGCQALPGQKLRLFARRCDGKRCTKVCERIQVVDGAKFIDMRKHRLHAACAGLEPVESQERVEPDQPTTGFVQALHFAGERIDIVSFQPVGDQQHHSALTQHTAGPEPVERGERFADARSARPILYGGGAFCQRLVGIAIAQLPRQVGQARAEDEAVDATAFVSQRVK